MTVDEIVNYYVQASQSTVTRATPPSRCPVILESWICIDISGKAVIHGQIQNHPHYSSGKPLKTSPIEGFCSDRGHIYVCTNNSMYELGVPYQNVTGKPLGLYCNHEMQSEQFIDWEKKIELSWQQIYQFFQNPHPTNLHGVASLL